jgi:superfamily II DNA or RNA helicase
MPLFSMVIPNNLLDSFQNRFDLKTFERGARYYRNGRVQHLNIDRYQGIISGSVRGSEQRIYTVVARCGVGEDGSATLRGHCSCPVGNDCKHLVALLFAAHMRMNIQEHPVPASQAPASVTPASVTLPHELTNWLAHAERLQRGRDAQEDRHCLLYQIELGSLQHRRVIKLTAEKVYRAADGRMTRRFSFDLLGRSQARFITALDQRILALTDSIARSGLGRSGRSRLPLSGPGSADLLELLATSGRAYWQPENALLHWQEPPMAGEFRWILRDDATLALQLHGERAETSVLPTDPPTWLDPATGDCGLIATELDPDTATLLAQAPAVPANAVDTFRQRLSERLPQLKLPMPPQIERRQERDIRPVPSLEFWSENRELPQELRHWGMPRESSWIDGAQLRFRYGQRSIPMDASQASVEDVRDHQVIEYPRDRAIENQAFDRLYGLGLRLMKTATGKLYLGLEDDDWLQLLARDVPKLKADGWEIHIHPSFRFQLVEVGDWDASIEEAQEAWFSLALGVEIDGERVDLLPLLVDLLQQFKDRYSPQALAELPEDSEIPLALPDGRYALMPLARLRPILTTLIELYDDKPLDRQGRLRLAQAQRGELAELDRALPDLRWYGAEQALEWGRRLRDFAGIEAVEPPAALNAELRPYQRKGLDWLQFLRDYELGGVLADDMGLGKTIQCLAHLLAEKAAGRADRPSLVVAPTSLMFNWRREAERFAPQLQVLTLQGPERREQFTAIPHHDLVLTTYPLLPRDGEALAKHDYHLLILDEAQAVKNPRSKAAEAVRTLNARHRLCLTGTPLENHLGELWSLVDFLMPGLLGDERRFKRLFRNPIERLNDQPRAEQLRRRLMPFMLRRTKEGVAPELPPKTEILREVPLVGEQRDLYETLRLAMHERVRREVERKGLARSGIVILDALLKLRQVCCDPRLLPLESARRVQESAKLELLLELLADLREEGRRILLFSQFASMLALIEDELQNRYDQRPERDYVKLTGRTRNRDVLVDRFQDGTVPLFLISLKAGGSGLNLTAADTVIHYDPWWNPAAERQATDRAHRIGQDKPVFVYKLLTEGTVEQKVAELQARKQALADTMLAGGSGAAAGLSVADLDVLFAPIAD